MSLKCQCGSVKFIGTQRCIHDVYVDENGNFIEDIQISYADRPYGPFYCAECGEECADE